MGVEENKKAQRRIVEEVSSVRYRCFLSGPETIRQYIKSYEYESKGIEQITKFTDFDWSFQIEEPTLEIVLSAN